MTVAVAPADRPVRRVRSWLPWVGLVVVVAVALAVGVQRHSKHPTLDQRVTSIASEVKCPVCVGETAAQSDTPASQELRVFIRRELVAGQNRATILHEIEADYGPSELEDPPAKGIDLALWVLPAVAVVVAAGGLVLLFRRWRPARIDSVSDDDRDLIGGLLGGPAAGPEASARPVSTPDGPGGGPT